MSWLQKLLPFTKTDKKRGVPEGLWTKCDACQAILYHAELKRNWQVCPKCNHHHRISGRERLNHFLDQQDVQFLTPIEPQDFLKFKDSKRYKERISAAQKETGEKDALIAAQGTVCGVSVVAAAFDFNFMGGSMGSAVGEMFVQAANLCLKAHLPLVCFSASGGARMQEGLMSLMQMAKTSAALARLREAQLPFISVLTDPTMGGVSASLAMLGDIIVAEPKALIGFAGPRVIEQTVRAVLPEGFQRSEFLLEHGVIDMIALRQELREVIANLLSKLMHRAPIKPVRKRNKKGAQTTALVPVNGYDASPEHFN